MSNASTLERYEIYRASAYKRDNEGRIKLDVTRLYGNGKCFVHVYAIRKSHTDRNARWMLKVLELPVPMRKPELREAMRNIAAVTAMEIGEDYVLRNITNI